MFAETGEEVKDGKKEEEGVAQQFKEDGFVGFGIIPYILKYCEVTNETITSAFKESVNFVFYIVSYEVLKSKEQERQLKQIRNSSKL